MTSLQTSEKSYAKLNLTLDIIGKRDDGYHEMLTVMQSVSLCDTVGVSLQHNGEFSCSTNFGFLPVDDKNIAVKAARLFLAAAGHPEMGCAVSLDKTIPVCAGMGGGSSNGAAVLRAMNRLMDYPLSGERMMELAHELGSDVGFCMQGGTALGKGRGDELTPLAPLPDCAILIVKPRFSIRTPMLFQQVDEKKLRIHPDTKGMVAALSSGDLPAVTSRLYNVFEAVLPRKYGEIEAIKNRMMDMGASASIMTGSGSAVFGVFAELPAAEKARKAFSEKYRECYTAQPVPAIARI